MTQTQPGTSLQQSSVRCGASTEWILRYFYIPAAILVGVGVWCLTDQRKPPVAWDFAHINDVMGFLFNNFGPFAFIPLGVIVGSLGVRNHRRVLVADDSGLGYGTARTAWDQIASIDASDLTSRGLVYLELAGGATMTLDSWKLTNFKQLIARLEASVPAERIKRS